jgi:hypothetical protein
MFRSLIMCARTYTIAVIKQVRRNDQDDGRDQQPQQVTVVEELLGEQEGDPRYKERNGKGTVVMFMHAIPKGINANEQGQQDHTGLEPVVIDDVDAEKREAGQ